MMRKGNQLEDSVLFMINQINSTSIGLFRNYFFLTFDYFIIKPSIIYTNLTFIILNNLFVITIAYAMNQLNQQIFYTVLKSFSDLNL
jgi:hypothetical protein